MTAPMLTPPEVAAMLRISEKTLRSWRYLGRGPAYVKFGRVRYHRTDVEEWLAARRVAR